MNNGLTRAVSTMSYTLPKTDLLKCTFGSCDLKIFLFSLILITFMTNISLISTAAVQASKLDVNGNGTNSNNDNTSQIHQILEAGLVIFSVNLILGVGAFYYTTFAALKVVNDTLPNVDQSKRAFFQLTAKKILQLRRQFILTSLLILIYFLPLAFYDDFFVDINCSKAMAVLHLGFLPVCKFLLGVFYLYFDFKRVKNQSLIKNKNKISESMSVSGNATNYEITEFEKPA